MTAAFYLSKVHAGAGRNPERLARRFEAMEAQRKTWRRETVVTSAGRKDKIRELLGVGADEVVSQPNLASRALHASRDFSAAFGYGAESNKRTSDDR